MVPTWFKPERATKHIRRLLRVLLAMEIIIIMFWCIWTERNDWLFNNEDTQVAKCKEKFKREFGLVIHRSKSSRVLDMKAWLYNLSYIFFFCIVLLFLNKISVGDSPLPFHQKMKHKVFLVITT
jgi:hypothetical protein